MGADAAPEKLGSLESGGTAYPLSSGADGIYVTSGHSIEVYTIDAANGKLGLARSNTEVYDENGNATYYRLDDQGQTVESTEEEYKRMGHLQQGGISYRIYCTEIGKGILTINKLTSRTNVLYNVYGR